MGWQTQFQEVFMTAATATMKSLYEHLSAVGIKKSFARQALPVWWDDAIADCASGIQQAQLYFSRAFNIEPSSLVNRKAPAYFRHAEHKHKFKLSRNVSEDQVQVSAHYATAMARLVLQTVETAYTPVPDDPNELRNRILKKHSCIDLASLLDYCTETGIPVLHIGDMPGRKMAGVAIRLGGRFAIVLSNKKHPAYLLFHLAHELGHIAKNHLPHDGFLVDQQIAENSKDDAEEKEADAYAIRLLNGAEVKYTARGRITSGKQLFNAASRTASETQVDVGHIILNYGNAQNNFAIANMALKHVVGPTDGGTVVNAALFRDLVADRLSEDQIHLLRSATGYTTS